MKDWRTRIKNEKWCVMKNSTKFYLQIYLGEVLVA